MERNSNEDLILQNFIAASAELRIDIQTFGDDLVIMHEEGERAVYVSLNKPTLVMTGGLIDKTIIGVYHDKSALMPDAESVTRFFTGYLKRLHLEYYNDPYTLLRLTQMTDHQQIKHLLARCVSWNIQHLHLQLSFQIAMSKGIPEKELIELHRRIVGNLAAAKEFV